MIERLTRNWWTFAIQGLAALVFGVLTLIWPGISLVVIIALFGAFAVVHGVMNVAASYEAHKHSLNSGSLLAAGILGLIAGLVTWFWPGLTALALLYVVVVWALVTGIVDLVASVEMRDVIPHPWFLTLTGLLSLALAAVLAVHPLSGILSLLAVIGIYAIIGGVFQLIFAFRLRKLRRDVSPIVSRLSRSA